VLFCTARFARSDFLMIFGDTEQNASRTLGIASIVAFFASLVNLRVDWKAKSARHRDAVAKLTSSIAVFRQSRKTNGQWPQDQQLELNRAYWDATKSIVEISERQFLSLKARHLRKVELSKHLDTTPACPLWLLRVRLLWRSIVRALGKT